MAAYLQASFWISGRPRPLESLSTPFVSSEIFSIRLRATHLRRFRTDLASFLSSRRKLFYNGQINLFQIAAFARQRSETVGIPCLRCRFEATSIATAPKDPVRPGEEHKTLEHGDYVPPSFINDSVDHLQGWVASSRPVQFLRKSFAAAAKRDVSAADYDYHMSANKQQQTPPVIYTQIIPRRPPPQMPRTPLWKKIKRFLEKLLAKMNGRFLVLIAAVMLSLLLAELLSLMPGAQLRKNVQILEQVYHDVYRGYVDPVDPTRLIHIGIEGMLSTLDPYTTFIDESNTEELGVLTYGTYGGVGLTIGEHNGHVAVFGTLDGYSAFEGGLRTGDRITHIDNKPLEGLPITDVRNLLRGDPGSSVAIRAQRLTKLPSGALDYVPHTFTLTRSRVHLKNVTHSTLIPITPRSRPPTSAATPASSSSASPSSSSSASRSTSSASTSPSVGYVRLERFANGTGDEVRSAIRDLQKKGPLSGVVLDVRGNPGGLLEAAVEVAQCFVKSGEVIVTTHGRLPESRKTYRSMARPILPSTPLVILTNNESASASEIVAGAVQDLDRGVVMGERTYGKGLIQKIKFLPFNTALKYTIGKYYTPSGRCIQSVDYSQQAGANNSQASSSESVSVGVRSTGNDATHESESRRQFKTRGGRIVREGGGIDPDVPVSPGPTGPIRFGPSSADTLSGGTAEVSQLESLLTNKLCFFEFANEYAARHPDLKPEFQVDDQVLGEFRRWLYGKGFDFPSGFESVFEALSSELKSRGYTGALPNLAALHNAVGRDKQADFVRHSSRIKERLRDEILARFYSESMRIDAALSRDQQLHMAVETLQDTAAYNSILHPPHLQSKPSLRFRIWPFPHLSST